MELYNTLTNAVISFDREIKQTVNQTSSWKLIPYACIPFYGPYLLNFRLETLAASIENPRIGNKALLIEEYHDTSTVLLAAAAIQALFLTLIPAIVFNMQLILCLSQAAIGIGLVYFTLQSDKKIENYRTQFLQPD